MTVFRSRIQDFLTETYIRLRRMENEALGILATKGMGGDLYKHVKVSIGQFYGIEINDFAVAVARTALWIAETQMLKETEDIYHQSLDCFPLKAYPNIVCANALEMDWAEVVAPENLNFIIGNPPFNGARTMTQKQKQEIVAVFGEIKNVENFDYVCGWYRKAEDMLERNSGIRVAFVSTNSVTQGEQVPLLWKPLLENGFHIDFAHRTFKWMSEAKDQAAVHCVVVGFSRNTKPEKKLLFNGEGTPRVAKNINGYLLDGADVYPEARKKPITAGIPEMKFGSQPRDGGNFILNDEEKVQLLKSEPVAATVVRRYVGAREFLHGDVRWCVWLLGQDLAVLDSCPELRRRVVAVRKFREASGAKTTRQYARHAEIFAQIAQPNTKYVIVPRVSSENRPYVPMGFEEPEVIASDAVQIVPGAELHHFAVLTSSVHMAWMKTLCGRLKSDYRYSKEIVYNDFPWPDLDERKKAVLAAKAQAVLDARAAHVGKNLAFLYGPETMPPDLRKAHEALDKAVMVAYGWHAGMEEDLVVAELLAKYRNLADRELEQAEAAKKEVAVARKDAPKKRRGRRPKSADVQAPAGEGHEDRV